MKHRKPIRILSALLALTLLLTFSPQLTLTADAATVGICGENLTWSFDEGSGTLTISGYGDMYDFEEYYEYNESGPDRLRSNIPWRSRADQIISVRLLDGLTSIGNCAFFNCVNLKNVSIPDSVTDIGSEAFHGCSSLQNVTIPAQVTTIAFYTFYDCVSLQSVTLPEGLTDIDGYAFSGCSSLQSVTIPDQVTVIFNGVFSDCFSLQSVTLPKGLTAISSSAFANCSSLRSIVIPEGVTRIDASAFYDCSELRSVTLPDSVKRIGYWAFSGTAFYNQSSNWTNGLLYLGNWLIGSEGWISTANIRPGTVGIADEAFASRTSLYSVTLPDSLESIGHWAFYGCQNLGYVKLPGSVKHIGTHAFLETGYYYNSANWSGDYLYLDDWLVFAESQSTQAIIREGTRGIADEALSWCNNLKYALFPESVTTIGNWTFSGCYDLRKVLVLNKDCTILDDYDSGYSLGDSYRTMVIGHSLSPVEAYARKYGYQFEDVTDASFLDVTDYDYYAEPVAWALENQITNGVAPYLFGPDSTCTRAQVVTFLWRAAGCPLPASRSIFFEDVAEDQYYYNAVLWAVERGITTGTSATRFSPNAGCTRAQVVTFLWRAMGKPTPTSYGNPFSDVKPVEYYSQAVLWAVENGITNGTAPVRFSPNAICTRAQIVTFLYRAYEQPADPIPINSNLVGVSMPTRDLQRWNQDGNNIRQLLEAAGYDVDLQFASYDISMQISQIENMIANGAKVLVITAIDGNSLGTVLAQAREAGCVVIAYDRLIMNSDAVTYYVTFDNWLVGVKQGEYIRDALDLDHQKGPFNIEFITGDPGDNNINFFFDGAMSVLQPYVSAGKLVTPSGQTAKMDVATANWATDAAQSRFENILSTYYTNRPLNAVLASNDSTAQGVAKALATSYSGSVYPVITGQDCDIVSVMNILQGKQAMSVFKDTRDLAVKTAEMVNAIMRGAAPPINDTETYDNGTGIIPSYLCAPRVCTKDTVQSLLIDSGYYTREDLGL